MTEQSDGRSVAARHDPAMRGQQAAGEAARWIAPGEEGLRLAGFAWYERDRVYRRLPLAARGVVPPSVDSLADCTAGGQIAFASDTRRVSVRVTLAAPAGMCHMPATGQCGFDLYVGDGASQRYCNTTKYDHTQCGYEVLLFEHPDAQRRTFTLYFPLYQGVRQVQVGVDPGASVVPPPAFARQGRIVVYGTSITQGGCASRPGMAHTNILSRRLDTEVVNLGFSGNGKGEPEVARFVAEVPEPCGFILDYDGNCPSVDRLRETLGEFIRILRRRHATVPILVVSRITFARDLVQAASRDQRLLRRDVQAEVVQAARAAGDTRVSFLDGAALLGEDFEEGTVDGVHPTDLGFWRMAEALEPVVRGMLEGDGG